jgi:DNA polymerase-3 subunit delta
MIYKSYLIEQSNVVLDKKFFLFFGENLGLKNDLKNKIKLSNKEAEMLHFNQDEIIKNDNIIFNEINNISLFEKEKIIFIEQVDDKILEIIKEICEKFNDQKIYLFSNILEKKSKIRSYFEKSDKCGAVACYADNEIGIRKIILNKLKGYSGLSPQIINLIIENSNLDRIKLNNELEKIVTYFQNKKIEYEKLEILLDIKINDNFNNLKDEALIGNKLRTNKLLSDTIIDSEKSIFYLTLINQRLNKLKDAINFSKETNLEDAISKIKPPVFWKDKPNFMLQTKKWNTKKIKKILNKTYYLEIEIKSNSTINKNILIKKLIVDVCLLANVS